MRLTPTTVIHALHTLRLTPTTVIHALHPLRLTPTSVIHTLHVIQLTHIYRQVLQTYDHYYSDIYKAGKHLWSVYMKKPFLNRWVWEFCCLFVFVVVVFEEVWCNSTDETRGRSMGRPTVSLRPETFSEQNHRTGGVADNFWWHFPTFFLQNFYEKRVKFHVVAAKHSACNSKTY